MGKVEHTKPRNRKKRPVIQIKHNIDPSNGLIKLDNGPSKPGGGPYKPHSGSNQPNGKSVQRPLASLCDRLGESK